MKKHVYIFIAFIGIYGLLSCGSSEDSKDTDQEVAVPVTTTQIPTRDLTTYLSYPTRIEGIINSEARSKIPGYITSVLVDEGQKVSQGQVLFRIETASLTEEAEAAKANIDVAQVQVNQLEPLVKQGIVSENQLATAKARLAQAKAAYQSISANIEYAVVRSPVDGYVGEVRIRKGNLVSPSDPIPLTTVADISKVYAYFSMNEKDYLDFLKTAKGKTKKEKISNMPEVTLVLANGDEYEHKGTIQTINSQIDKQTGTVSFRAVFDNPDQILTNGSSGEIKIPSFNENVVVVPQKSTFEQLDQTFVAKVVKDNEKSVSSLQRIFIKGGTENLYIVESGINEGDEIIIDNAARMREGTLISPHKIPFDSVVISVPTVFR